MGIWGAVKRYRRRLAKRFTRDISRRQLNIATDRAIVAIIRLMAHKLEIPLYVLCEHTLQLGLSEIAILTKDESQKERLCRHLVKDHLLVSSLEPEHKTASRRALKLKNAMEFMTLLETRRSPENIRRILMDLWEKTDESGSKGIPPNHPD